MDTKNTIIVAKQETLRQMELEVADEQTCANTIGMSAKIGFQKLCPELSEDMINLCVKRYREIFDEIKKVVPPVLFSDMVETLNKLKKKGIVCTIATLRGRNSLIEFLESMGIMKYFSYILAAEDTAFLKPNAEPVKKILVDLSYGCENTLVVVDMPFDIIMGKNAGVHTCGVTYGVSDKKSLLEVGADWIIDNISDLLEIV